MILKKKKYFGFFADFQSRSNLETLRNSNRSFEQLFWVSQVENMMSSIVQTDGSPFWFVLHATLMA